MTKEEAAEIVLLGWLMPCEQCGGTGYVSHAHTTVKIHCLRCGGTKRVLRPHWPTAMLMLGLTED